MNHLESAESFRLQRPFPVMHKSLYRKCDPSSIYPGAPLRVRPHMPSSGAFSLPVRVFYYPDKFRSGNVLTSDTPHTGITLSIFLTKNEIKALTLRVHHGTQARVLAEMGIRFILRPDGSPVVLHSALMEVDDADKKLHQPDFSSLV